MTTLLAVDDSNTMRKVLEITFAGEPYETLLASSAEEAMLKLGERRPPVALIDITLGDADGYDLCRRVKTEFPATRVVLLSSKQSPYDAGRGNAAGADDHIDKPFETQALIEKVGALVQAGPAEVAAPIAVEEEMLVVEEVPISEETMEPFALEAAPKPQLIATPLPPEPDLAPPPPKPVAPVAAAARPIAAPPAMASAPAPIVNPPTSPSASLSQPAASALNGASLKGKLDGLGLNDSQIEAILALSKEVVEQVVWEVVPALAEALIQEEIARLTKE